MEKLMEPQLIRLTLDGDRWVVETWNAAAGDYERTEWSPPESSPAYLALDLAMEKFRGSLVYVDGGRPRRWLG
ncbi:MAG: hypothetical protein IT303_14125 [Dehalococcoidia bacterium]|nr:hypothetical protein [Dehalococcoidia bacterium]